MEPITPVPESPEALPQAPAMSPIARFLNIFATPSDVFEDIKKARVSAANWLVPILIYGLLGAVSSVLIFSQPAIIEQIRGQKNKAMEAKVAAGKLTQAQADQAIEAMEKFSSPRIMQGFGAGVSVLAGFVSVFWWALLLWLVGRFCLKAQFPFMKAAELAGLANIISSLDIVLRTLLILGFSNVLAAPSLALFLKDPDPQDKLFMALSILNVMTFWVLAVRSIGLAKLTGASTGRAAAWLFGIWIFFTSLGTGLSLALQKIFG